MFHRPRVLFICVHNGGRSQMCEAFLKHYAGDRFDAHSAGLEPGKLNPLAVEVMAEIGIEVPAGMNVYLTVSPAATAFLGTSRLPGIVLIQNATVELPVQ